MKLTTLIITLTILQVSAASFAQRITLSQKNVTLSQVFKEIHKQTGYNVLWSATKLETAKPIDVNFKDTPLVEALDKIFAGQLFTYEIDDKNVIIKEKAPSIIDKLLKALTPSPPPIITIDGQVTDTKGEPLVGVIVLIKGTSKGVITDANGYYKLQVNLNDKTLVFSCVGMIRQEVAINGRTVINVVMAEEISKLGTVEIVSTGYQTLPKERATGSFAIIDSALFNRSASPNILNRLNGLASGVYMSAVTAPTNFSNQGRTLTYMIRGLSTINSTQSPLVIVDGFPFRSTAPYYQDINSLNPDDIESITVLKDAAAASIWGARAGNGVLVITTKKGKFNQKPTVSFNIGMSITPKPDLFSDRSMSTSDIIDVEKSLFNQKYYDAYNTTVLNSTTYRPVSQVVSLLMAVKNGTLSQTAADAKIAALSKLDVRNDLKKYFYQTAVSQKYDLNVRGGGDKYKYFISAAYDNDNGVSYDFQKRANINMTNTFSPIKNLEISLPISYSNNNTGSNVNTDPNSYSNYSPYTQFTDVNGNPQNVIYRYGYNDRFLARIASKGLYDMNYNPINQFNTSQYTHYNTTLVTLSPSIKYSMPNGFSVELTYSYSKTLKSTETYRSDSVWTVKDQINQYTQISRTGMLTFPVNRGGFLNERTDLQVDNNIRALLNYNHNLGADHRIDAVAGYDRSESTISSNYNGWYGYNSLLGTLQSTLDNGTSYNTNAYYSILDVPLNFTGKIGSVSNGIIRQFTAFVAYFGNAAYTYKNRYTISGSVRTDEANIFGVSTNNKQKVLWSVGGSWRIDQEKFYNLAWLPVLKLRTTYGKQGNIPNFSVQSLATITYKAATANSSNLPYATLNNLPNPDLRWEQTAQLNLGLDFGIKGNIVSGSIDYYTKKGTDLIGTFNMDPSTGVTSNTGNMAAMKGSGVDVTVNTKNFNTRDFSWNTKVLFSHNTDEVTAYYPTTKYYQLTSIPPYTVGCPVNSIYSYKWAGLDPLTGNPQGYVNGKVSTDYATILNYTTRKDIVYNGPANPTVFGSIMNTFSYKGFDLSANITYEAGHYIRLSSINYSTLFGGNMLTSRGDIDYNRRWQKPGDELTTNVPSMPTTANSSSNRDNFYLYSSALVVKGDNIRLQDISLSYDLNRLHIKGSPFGSLQLYGYYLVNAYLWRAVDYKQQAPSQTISFGIRATLK